MNIHRIVSDYHNSNCFIVEINESQSLVIDPGDPEIYLLKSTLERLKTEVVAVFLTHEHSDHCAGVNSLSKNYNFDLFCSHACSINIGNSKQNFSFYIEIIDEFTIQSEAIILKDNQTITIGNKIITFYETPGHSPGSACILIDSCLFTGDTILNGIKTPLSFPHSNRLVYKQTLNKLRSIIHDGTSIYPGHGEPFIYKTGII